MPHFCIQACVTIFIKKKWGRKGGACFLLLTHPVRRKSGKYIGPWAHCLLLHCITTWSRSIFMYLKKSWRKEGRHSSLLNGNWVDYSLFFLKKKNCQQIPPETSIVFLTLLRITELTQLNIFALIHPP